MVKLLALIMLLASAVTVFSMPWVAALSYSVVSILQPQHIWFWAFEGIPVFKITAALAIIGWLIAASQKNIDWDVYKSGQFIGLVLLVVVMHLSNLLSPFSHYFAGVGGDLVLGIMNTILIMYFFVLGLINKKEVLLYCALIMVITTLWYTYEANQAYLQQDWSKFFAGRLRGADTGPYKDGNVLSVVVIVGLPFILFGIQYFQKRWIQIGLLLSIPLVWHALVLYASRGALLSAGVLTLCAAIMMRSKILNIMLVAGFAAFLATQGGALMERAKDTVSASQTQTEQPINPRLVSWSVGARLALQYPILGVGPQRFQYASRLHFPGESPHVAHNTFLNFSANTGLIAGFIFLSFFFISFRQFGKVRKSVDKASIYAYINNASIVALLGYFVGGMFLDLIIFEPFYFLLVLITANYYLAMKEKESGQQEKAVE